jgi:hypothetical protein
MGRENAVMTAGSRTLENSHKKISTSRDVLRRTVVGRERQSDEYATSRLTNR